MRCDRLPDVADRATPKFRAGCRLVRDDLAGAHLGWISLNSGRLGPMAHGVVSYKFNVAPMILVGLLAGRNGCLAQRFSHAAHGDDLVVERLPVVAFGDRRPQGFDLVD